MRNFAVLLPAAGASSRMRGGDKLLELIESLPCLRVMAMRALSTGAQVFVTLPSPKHPRVGALDGLNVTPIWVPDAAMGMAHSLKRGVAALPPGIRAAMIIPPDMPMIQATDISRLFDQFDSAKHLILQATNADGTPGHPILFDHALFREFQELEGDIGARSIIARYKQTLAYVALPDNRATKDLDTPEDWADWRASV